MDRAVDAAPRDGTTPAQPLLHVDGVVAGYGGGDILHGVSFEVSERQITCIVGPNGAGKSTLLSVVSGLLIPRLGAVRLKGADLCGHSPREILERGVVQVPQNHSLFRNMTVWENVRMGGFLIRDRKLLAERLERVVSVFPIVAERRADRAGSLSGGQQRLVEFARSLMLDPVLMILDEPSMGLDPRALDTVFDTIHQMRAEGRTILLVEQNARAGLELSDRGVVLENGLVRLVGTGDEVLNHPEIGALYLGGAVPAP